MPGAPIPYNTIDSPYMLPPDPGVDARRSKVAGWLRKYLDLIRGNTDLSSPNYPPSVNFGLKGLQKVDQLMTGNPALISGIQPPAFAKSAFDWMFTPETTQDKRAAAAAATAPPQPTINLQKLRQPFTPATGDKPITMFEMPQPDIPAPPTDTPFQMGPAPHVSAYQQPQPPDPSVLPPPVDQVGPDYTEFNKWENQAAPMKSSVDWAKQKKLEAFAGLSHGAAHWNPSQGWGGLLAGSFDGVAQGVLDNRKNELNANDAFAKEMQQFAADRAKIALAQAGDQADLTNSNADRTLKYQTDTVNQRNQLQRDRYNVDSGNAERTNAATNTNLAADYETNQKNLAAVHESNVANGQNRYKLAVEKAQREAPQVESITKDGAVVITTEGGKRILKYQPFKNIGMDPMLENIKKQYGEDSGVYKMHKAKALLEQGDDVTLMKSMVDDSLGAGYAPAIFGDAYKAAKDEVENNIIAQPGSKEYPAEFNRAMTAALLRHMNLADPEMMRAFAENGNIEAQYLLSGEESGSGNQGR